MTRRRALLRAPSVLAALLAWGATSGTGLRPLAVVCLALLASLVVAAATVAALLARRATAASRRAARDAGRALGAATRAQTAAERLVRSEPATKAGVGQALRQQAEQLRVLAAHDTAQTEAMLQLVSLLRPEWPLPRLRGWAASPDSLLALSSLIREERPRLVVDLGSGSSTIVAALTLRRFGIPGRVVSLDHDAGYAEQTRRELRRHGLDDLAEVRYAPLVQQQVDDEERSWYDPDAVEDLEGIGLVYVDGPPGSGAPLARYPALARLRQGLAPGAVLLLDDADRPDEREIVARWEQILGATAEWLPLEKGGAALRAPGAG